MGTGSVLVSEPYSGLSASDAICHGDNDQAAKNAHFPAPLFVDGVYKPGRPFIVSGRSCRQADDSELDCRRLDRPARRDRFPRWPTPSHSGPARFTQRIPDVLEDGIASTRSGDPSLIRETAIRPWTVLILLVLSMLATPRSGTGRPAGMAPAGQLPANRGRYQDVLKD